MNLSPRDFCRGALALAMLLLALHLPAQDFEPNLGQPLEAIDGGQALDVTIPAGAVERTAYPLQVYYPKPLLTEVPGKPFKQVSPAPQWPAFWKYPFYAVLGFPRDLFDGAIGFFSHLPLISSVLYVGYEIVPTQAFMRDPRDWHRWDGNLNRHGHGYYDGSNWGYFPSLNTWKFTYTSNWAARHNQKKNETLQQELNKRNREIEAANFKQSEALRETRREALTAIEKGEGSEAVKRALPAREAYPQDEGIYALYVTALAVYAGQAGAPEWVRPVLWRELNTAQPRPLEAAEKLLEKTAQAQPGSLTLGEALIYARELQGREGDALKVAQELLAKAPNEPYRKRLVLETAISAGKNEVATPLLQQLQQDPLPDRELLAARLELLQRKYDAARERLLPLQTAHPENANYSYYLGATELAKAHQSGSGEDYQRAFQHMEQAALQAPNAGLRLRAGQSLAYLRGVMTGIRENPGLFKDETTTGTVEKQ